MTEKLKRLRLILEEMESILVAFSGGIDSTYLLKSALDVLGPGRVLAVTASSETYPAEEGSLARGLAGTLGARHMNIITGELSDQHFTENPPDRCYYCKHGLFTKLLEMAAKNSLRFVADGANKDDMDDFRPGMRAGRELGVRSPLQEAGLTKNDIRTASKKEGLPNWNKPSMPCLSSRFPYGHRITPEKLKQVDEAERFLRSQGFEELRVRHHGDIARIEVPEYLIARIAADPLRQHVTAKLTSLGFKYISIDLCGFRSGSMNETLPKEILDGQG